MARGKKPKAKRAIESYEHKDKRRVNNPPVGLVTPETDPDPGAKRVYSYDPHLDPQLVWAGKAEHTSFEVPTVSLHVHERIDPRTIIEAVRKRNGDVYQEPSLFEGLEENPPLREAIEFYKHAHGWTNRLIAGDSLLVMNSLLEKEGMAGKVQMIYMDPPYGIKYRANFQPFVSKRAVSDSDKDDDLSGEPEVLTAFRDTWQLGVHSYLTYLRDRLHLSRELLSDSGSCFVQTSDENVHLVRTIMDEVYGSRNFVATIAFRTKVPLRPRYIAGIVDYIIWYAVDKRSMKYHSLFQPRDIGEGTQFTKIELPNGERREMTAEERTNARLIPKGARVYRHTDLVSSGSTESCMYDFELNNQTIRRPPSGKSWKTTAEGMKRLIENRRVEIPPRGKMPAYCFFWEDYPVQELTNVWTDTQGAADKTYVVQTATKPIERCLLMTTDPGDLVLDPTCGSGTTACVAENCGRRWITCDTSRVALALTRKRLMTAVFDYFDLAHPDEGVSSGFLYKTVPHVTLGSIANDGSPGTETLYDQPLVDTSKTRVSGPFTFEAVPAPTVKPIDDLLNRPDLPADSSVSRSGETIRQAEWRDELMKSGIRGKAGQYIRFARLEPLPGCRSLHADGETRVDDDSTDSTAQPQRVVVSFGPDFAPLEQRQVEHAIEEARTLVPKPSLIVFAAFQFDSEAAKDIDETQWPGVTLLKVQMNADLLTEDLKKKRSSNESFWLIGQPDVQVETINEGPDKGKMRVSVHGFDYYNTKTGGIESGGPDKIAIWMLDTDYDGRSLFPRQVFFPMSGDNDGWTRLAKSLKAEIDQDLIESYKGTISLPFEPGDHKRIAVKIVDDRGIESLVVREVD